MFFYSNFLKFKKSDDFIFFKLLSKSNVIYNSKKNQDTSEIYKFNVEYKKMKFKSINLNDTIEKNIYSYEKIAPGTKGSFVIQLNSNKKLKYQIQFKSINEKPNNLRFMASQNESELIKADSLEKLSEELSGNINKFQKIDIEVFWYWNYEENKYDGINEENQYNMDFQDTKDAQNIKQYRFNVYVIGEEI